METVIEKHNLCKSIKNDRGKPQRKNRYIITHEIADGLLLYNTLTLGMAFLPGCSLDDWESETFDHETRDRLMDDLFIVADDFDEQRTLTQLKGVMAFYEKPLMPYYNIFTTMACNARCKYCSERLWKKTKHVSPGIAKDIADFIVKRNNGETIYIRWFGGEPLLNTEAIDIICDELKKNGVKFTSDITTNGYRFDEIDIAAKIEEWNLKIAFITIDGTPEVYKKIKDYVGNPENPFEHVMGNIQHLLDNGVTVQIRLNVSPDNIDDIFELVEMLHTRFGKYNGFSISSSPLFEYLSKETDAKDLMFLSRYHQLVERLGNKIPPLPRKWKSHRCNAESKQFFSISADGKLNKCYLRMDDKLTGDIYSGSDPRLEEEFKKPLVVDRCRDCNMRLLCCNMEICPKTGGVCNEFNRREKEYGIRRKMVHEYERWKTKS